MVKKRSSINLSISESEKQQLEGLAASLNLYWGDKPNISALMKRIAQGRLRVIANDDWTTDRIETLAKIRTLLTDRGNQTEAITIAELLLERSELNRPLRKELISFLAKPAPPWRLEIEKFRHRLQPFRLTYQDAADRLWEFHIYSAEIQQHEDREYLDCWCAETEGNKDLPALKHNWCLRLDRIPEETVITEIAGRWRHLDFIEVEFHLLNTLASAYRCKKQTEEFNEWHPEIPQVRQVIRKVTNTFWFLREIRRYGPDCVIISPQELRDQLKNEYIKQQQIYETYPT